MDERSKEQRGPIAFFLRNLPACFAVIGAAVIAAPWLLVQVTLWQIERSGIEPYRTMKHSQISFALIPTWPTVSFANFAAICGCIGAALLVASFCLARRRRGTTTDLADECGKIASADLDS